MTDDETRNIAAVKEKTGAASAGADADADADAAKENTVKEGEEGEVAATTTTTTTTIENEEAAAAAADDDDDNNNNNNKATTKKREAENGKAVEAVEKGDDDEASKETTKDEKKVEKAEASPPAAPAAPAAPATKKARIARQPVVAQSLLDVDEYTLDEPPPAETNTDCEDRIDTPSIILFGLHPLIKEPPLKKMCEKYGRIQNMGVRSAFASRYGHVEYTTVAEAQCAYKALNGAKLLHKAILVQPTKPSTATGVAVTAATVAN